MMYIPVDDNTELYALIFHLLQNNNSFMTTYVF